MKIRFEVSAKIVVSLIMTIQSREKLFFKQKKSNLKSTNDKEL